MIGSGTRDGGRAAYEFARRLFPLCRSLTGSGVRATFDLLEEIPIRRTEIPSGTKVFDWVVPEEWNIRDAYIAAEDGTRVVDFRPFLAFTLSRTASRYARGCRSTSCASACTRSPTSPISFPYRTSYYERTWGFCLSHRQLLDLETGEYEVVIDSSLEPGHLSFGKCVIEGEDEREVLISTYVCHPSLANDNLSGIVAATMLARELLEHRPRYTYRFLFAPGTIGPLAWLHQNRKQLDRVVHGLTLACIGDSGPLTYKRSRSGDAEIDRAVETVLRDSGAPHRVLPWEPWGGDERQFGSPGFDLPVGSLTRTPHGEFNGYERDPADDLSRIRPESLSGAIDTCLAIAEALDTNRTCTNLRPFGEPRLRPPRPVSIRRGRRAHAADNASRIPPPPEGKKYAINSKWRVVLVDR